MTGTLDILDRLIAFDTVSDRSNLDLIAYVEDFLRQRGFAVTRLPDATGRKAGLFATLGPEGAGIALSAHSDVVPVEGQPWTRNPFALTREGDRLYGRGTTDMKGFLACMLSAADRAAARPLAAPLSLVISYDEEVGCVGVQEMAEPLAPLLGRPRLCIVGEPTGMDIATGHKGKASMRAVCRGQAGHSALAPNFVNALHLAADFISELRAAQAWLEANGARDDAYAIPYSTIHVGRLAGGTALNIVPDRAELVFEWRALAGDAPETLASLIAEAASSAAARHRALWDGAAVEVETLGGYPGLEVSLAGPAIALARSLAQEAAQIKVAFGTEAGVLSGLGAPSIVCGPGSMEGQGHKPDEYVTLDQLAACDRMMDRVLDELC